MAQEARNPIGAAETAFEIVEGVRELEGAGVTELAIHLDLPKSTVHNYLSTLTSAEYLVSEEGRYQIGTRFLQIGTHARNRQAVYPFAVPEVERLAEETGELANLLIEEHGRGVYLYRSTGDQAVQVDTQDGSRVYLHSTALGKAILAYSSSKQVDGIVDRHGLPAVTDQTITDEDRLHARLESIRDRGYAIDDEERLNGLRCIAAPILSIDDKVLAAISISGPTSRMRGDRFKEAIPELVLEAANVIQLNVTHS